MHEPNVIVEEVEDVWPGGQGRKATCGTRLMNFFKETSSRAVVVDEHDQVNMDEVA